MDSMFIPRRLDPGEAADPKGFLDYFFNSYRMTELYSDLWLLTKALSTNSFSDLEKEEQQCLFELIESFEKVIESNYLMFREKNTHL